MESVQIWLAVSISVILPGLCLIIIYSLDLYSSSSFRFVLLSFGWGGVGGLGLAYLLNTRILIPLIDAARWDYLILFLFFAPVLEEFLKSIPLLYIYQRPEFTYIVDGAVYGFASGIGFSITENFMYINIFQEEALTLAISRVISTCLMHGSATALIGIMLGRFRFQRHLGKTLLVSGWIMAILLHALFNAIVVFFFPNGSLLMATIIGLVGSGLVTLLIYLGFREERKWLVESLDQKIVDLLKTELTIDEQEWLADFMSQQTGVSFAEVRASQFYESLNDILEPIAQQFPRKSKLLKRIVLQQAQISIKRKVLKELQDGKRRLELEQEIAQMQDNVINLRRDAGGCMMIYIQCVFEKDGADIVHCLERAVDCVREYDSL